MKSSIDPTASVGPSLFIRLNSQGALVPVFANFGASLSMRMEGGIGIGSAELVPELDCRHADVRRMPSLLSYSARLESARPCRTDLRHDRQHHLPRPLGGNRIRTYRRGRRWRAIR